MSPTHLTPGACAVKSRATSSATACSGSPAMVVRLYGFGCSCHEIQFPHQLVTDVFAGANQLGVDAPIPIGAVERVEQRLDLDPEFLAAFVGRAGRARVRLVVAA